MGATILLRVACVMTDSAYKHWRLQFRTGPPSLSRTIFSRTVSYSNGTTWRPGLLAILDLMSASFQDWNSHLHVLGTQGRMVVVNLEPGHPPHLETGRRVAGRAAQGTAVWDRLIRVRRQLERHRARQVTAVSNKRMGRRGSIWGEALRRCRHRLLLGVLVAIYLLGVCAGMLSIMKCARTRADRMGASIFIHLHSPILQLGWRHRRCRAVLRLCQKNQ